MAGLSRKKDYGSKRKPYPSVKASDFAAPGRKYPIPTEADAKDAAFLARIHHRPDVLKKIHQRYPNVMQDGGITHKPLPEKIRKKFGINTDTISLRQYNDENEMFLKYPQGGIINVMDPYSLGFNYNPDLGVYMSPDGIIKDIVPTPNTTNKYHWVDFGTMDQFRDKSVAKKELAKVKKNADLISPVATRKQMITNTKGVVYPPEYYDDSVLLNEYGLGGWIKDNLQGVVGGLKIGAGVLGAIGTLGLSTPLSVGLISSGADDIVGEISRDQQAKQYEELQTQQAEKTSPLSYTNSFAPTFAFGGLMPGMKPTAELEKQEVTEAPDGSMLKVNAPTHSQGGIDLPLQQGTRVFSDRLKTANGKTYAEIADGLRKKKAKYEKILNS